MRVQRTSLLNVAIRGARRTQDLDGAGAVRSLVRQLGEQFAHSPAQDGMVEIGTDFGERSENETPVGQLGMRHGECGGFVDEAVHQQQVEVESAGAFGDAGGAVPAEGALDCQ